MFTGKELRKLIIPLIIEQILAVTIGMADTVMVSSVGEAAVSGISLVDTVNLLLINIFSALATGGAVIGAQYLGRRDEDSACIAAKQLLYSITALSLVISAVSITLHTPLLSLVFGNIEPAVMSNAQTYFLVSAISYPFLAIYNAGAALFRSMGNSRVSMLVSVLMNLINITGNAVFIFVFDLGVFGAALASLLSRMTGAVIMLILLHNPVCPIHVERLLHPQLNFPMIRNILYIGVPNGLESGVFQVGKVLVSSLVASFGTTAIAANAVANNVASLEVIPGAAMGLAMITVVGQCVGAGEREQAKQYAKKLMKIVYISVAALNVVVLALAPTIANFYSLSPETADIAIKLMWIHGVFCPLFWPTAFTLPNALRAAGDVRYTMFVSILTMWFCRILLSYVLGAWLGLGILGVWGAMVIDWVFRSIFFVGRFVRGKWLKIKVIRD